MLLVGGDSAMSKFEPIGMPILRPIYMPIRESGGFWVATCHWMTTRRKWQLVEDWEVVLPEGNRIVLPAGFISDGATAPRIFWPFMPPAGPLLLPSLIHDFAYRYGYLWELDGKGGYRKIGQTEKRAHWDRLFHRLGLMIVGRNLLTAPAGTVMWMFGWYGWCKARRRPQKELPPGQKSSVRKDPA